MGKEYNKHGFDENGIHYKTNNNKNEFGFTNEEILNDEKKYISEFMKGTYQNDKSKRTSQLGVFGDRRNCSQIIIDEDYDTTRDALYETFMPILGAILELLKTKKLTIIDYYNITSISPKVFRDFLVTYYPKALTNAKLSKCLYDFVSIYTDSDMGMILPDPQEYIKIKKDEKGNILKDRLGNYVIEYQKTITREEQMIILNNMIINKYPLNRALFQAFETDHLRKSYDLEEKNKSR